MYALPAVKDTHSVTVTFQLPSLQAAYAAKVITLLLGIHRPMSWPHGISNLI